MEPALRSEAHAGAIGELDLDQSLVRHLQDVAAVDAHAFGQCESAGAAHERSRTLHQRDDGRRLGTRREHGYCQASRRKCRRKH